MDNYDENSYNHGEDTPSDVPQGEPQQDSYGAQSQPNSQDPYGSQPQQAPQSQSDTQPQQNVSGTYQGIGAGRKESPYANSPYETNYGPQNQSYTYQYQPQPQPQASEEKPSKKQPRKHNIWRGVAAVALTLVVVVGCCLITAYCVNKSWEATSSTLNERIDALESQLDAGSASADSSDTTSGSGGTIVQAQTSDGTEMSLKEVYANCVDSVVAISSTVESTGFYGSTSEGTSSGSGFVLTADGYVITNYHVIEDAKDITVTLHDGSEYTATVKGYDSTNDVAVLKIEATGLSAATIGKSSDLSIGDMVVAIGNPLGELTATQTVGYVSGVNREITTDSSTVISMIQTDAAINPGNSGGPLFNMKGEVVGITTAKYSGTTSSGASIEGLGFAIPIDDVVSIINDLIDYGYVTGAYMGITVKNTDSDSVSMYGLPNGAYVVEVVEGGSADRAGIQAKDIITDLGGTTISNITELTRALRNFSAGDTTTVTVVRSGQEMTLEITLDEKPQSTSTTDTESTIPEPDDSMPSDGSYEEWYNWFFGQDSDKNG